MNGDKLNFLSIDPGEKTGVAEVVVDLCTNTIEVKSYTLSVIEIMNRIKDNKWLNFKIWVIEQFLLYPWRSSGISFSLCIPAQIIGIFRQYQFEHPEISLVYQTAGEVKGSISDKELTIVTDIYDISLRSKHEKDALKHAVYYLIKRKIF